MKKLTNFERSRLLQVSLWVVKSRWIYYFGILLISYVTKIVNVAMAYMPFWLIWTIFGSVALLNILYHWFFKNGRRWNDSLLQFMAFLSIFTDVIVISICFHYAGGIESTSFLYYIYIIIASSFIYGFWGTMLFALFCSLGFLYIIWGEYYGFIYHIQRYTFPLPYMEQPRAIFTMSVNVIISYFITAIFSGFLANLAKRKEEQLFNEKQKTESIIHSLDDGLLVFDKNGKISHFNDQFKSVLNISDPANPQKSGPFKQVLEFIYSDNELEKWSGKPEDYAMTRDFLIDLPSQKYLKVISFPLRERGEAVGVVRMVRDETKEKQLEKIKSEFVTVTAHQLRTPLSAVKWAFDALRGGDLGKLTPEQEDIANKGFRSNEQMIKLVNDFLNASAVAESSFQFDFTQHDLVRFLRETIASFEGLAGAKNIKISFDSDLVNLSLCFDPRQLKIVFENLLENAVSYTLSNGSISVGLKADAHKKEVRVSVKDSGVGIPKTEQDRIFSKFFRGKNVVKLDTEGSGLGLYICRTIIERHGGKIWFESQEGQGTIFYFNLPLR